MCDDTLGIESLPMILYVRLVSIFVCNVYSIPKANTLEKYPLKYQTACRSVAETVSRES